MVATIAPSKNVSGPTNLLAGTNYPLGAITPIATPPTLTPLDTMAIEEGSGITGIDTLHGQHYWTIGTDGKTYTVWTQTPVAGEYYSAPINVGGAAPLGGTLSKGGFLGLGTVGEEIAVVGAGAVVIIIIIIAVLLHTRK